MAKGKYINKEKRGFIPMRKGILPPQNKSPRLATGA